MTPRAHGRRRALAALFAIPAAGALRAAEATPAATPRAVRPALAAPAAFGTRLSGGQATWEVRPGDSLALVGARLGALTRVIARDNGLKPQAALRPGTVLAVDHRRVVPAPIDHGIVVSLAQRMLFHFERGALRAAYPIAVGRPDWPTPTGPFKVANLQIDKPWIVPKSIQEEMRREGKPVLTRVPPGPDNPLGRHWIGLSIPSLGIHGTIAPTSIHDFRSHGCIRLHPDDAAELHARVEVGTPGIIVYHVALLAELPDGRIFVEVDRDAYRRAGDPVDALQALADGRGLSARIDWGKVRQVARERDGVAREVGLTPPAAQPQVAAPEGARPAAADPASTIEPNRRTTP